VLGGEANVGMRFVDLVSDHLVLLVIFLMAALAVLKEVILACASNYSGEVSG
jgi:hypothetical protein